MDMSRTSRTLRYIGGTLLVVAICVIFYYIVTGLVQTLFTTSSATSQASVASGAEASSAQSATDIKKAASTTKLQAIVTAMTSQYGTNVGIVLTDLSNDTTASANADTQFVSASIYKLFVAYGIYSKIDAGEISLSDSMASYGVSSTVTNCLNLMLTISDNTCGVALGEMYGWGDLDAMLASRGYTHTVLNNYDAAGNLSSDKQTAANDVAKLLKALYKGTLVSASSTEQFISLLKADQINYMLPSGLPSGTVVAHKVGYLEDYQHDAGIVYSAKGDMLVVMLTKGWSNPTTDAAAAFKVLGQAVWSYLSP
jgi:beta-lactamase class A